MPKICIDAGHFGRNNNNPNVTPVYWESIMAWELHLMLKEELERYEGITVITTRAVQDQDLEVYQRGRKAAGCDLFVSLHSNACTSEAVDRPVVIYPVSGKCKALAQSLATKIRQIMATHDEERIYDRWNSAHNADYYGVIRGAASVGVPGLIIEHSFHSNNRAAKWLQSEDNLRKLAIAEARLIADHFGCEPKTDKECIEMTIEELEQFVEGIIEDKMDEQFPKRWLVERKAYSDSLSDNDCGKWSKDARDWAVENGIVAGVGTMPDGTTNYAWQQPLTREQYVTLEYQKEKKKGGDGDA